MPAVGDLAPEVALPDETGTIHHLSDQRGRWTILYFYPEDDTPGCTDRGVRVPRPQRGHPRARRGRLGRQPGRSGEPREFREKFELPFTLLADEGHPVADAYGAWGRSRTTASTYMGLIRSTFLIDPDGRDRQGLAEGQGPGPRGGRPHGTRRAPGSARVVTRRGRGTSPSAG